MAIQVSEIRGNKVDRLKVASMSKKLFSEQDWRSAVSNGAAEAYANALMLSDKIDPNEFYSKYNLYYGDPNSKLSALFNEVGANRTDVNKYKIPRFDANGNYVLDENGKNVMDEVEMTEYDYNKKILFDSNSLYAQRVELERQNQERLNRQNFLADVGAILGQFGTSTLRGFENIGSFLGANLEELLETGWQAIKYPFVHDEYGIVNLNGEEVGLGGYLKGDESYAETMHKWFTDNAVGDELQSSLDQFAYNNTHFFDENGEMTTAGKYLLGAADTIGKMIPTILVTYATAGAGSAMTGGTTAINAGSKVGTFLTNNAGNIGQLAFYGSNVFGTEVSEQYEYYASKGISISSSEIVSNALVKSALQISVERGLGKLLGATGIDNMMYGTDPKSNIFRFSKSSLTKNAFLRLGKDALQEGLEESLQETSDWLVDAMHHFINNDFQSTEWSWQNIGDAFAIALLTSTVGGAARIVGTKRIGTGMLKTDKSGNLVKDKNGKYVYEKLGKIASYEFGLDMQSYVESINAVKEAGGKFKELYDSMNEDERKNSKALDKAMSEYTAAYYQTVASFQLLSSVYGEMGQARFNKANEILAKIRESQEAGVFDEALRKKSQEELVNSLENLNADVRTELTKKVIEANMTRKSKDITEESNDNDKETKEAKKFMKELKGISTVTITEDGTMPVHVGDVLMIPKNLLVHGNDKIVMASLAEQELADELSRGVLTKSKYFKNEVGIITDLYRQWCSDADATSEQAIYNLIFDTKFFEVVLAVNEKITSSFLLRLNGLVDKVGKKQGLKDNLLNKRIQECRQRWIEAAFNFYSNNLSQDTSLFTKFLTADERKAFDERISKLLTLYNMGQAILVNPSKVTDEIWAFVERRIDGMNVEKEQKDKLKSDIRDNSAKTRQSALDTINTWYDGAFDTLYNGKVYMPNNSVGNYAFNSWLQSLGLSIKTVFNDRYLTDEDLMALGNDYTVDDLIAYRQLQFSDRFSNMTFDYANGNIVVKVDDEADGFELYLDALKQHQKEIITGKSFKIGEKSVEQGFIRSLKNISSFIKEYLRNDLIEDDVHQFLTVSEFIDHLEYLNDAVQEDIYTQYGVLDRISAYRYFQNELTSKTNGKQCLLLRQNGDVVIGDVSKMDNILKKKSKFPTSGVHSIRDFIDGKYLKGILGNVNVEFVTSGGTEYRDYEKSGDVYVFVNKIRIDVTEHSTDDAIKFALLHEFQHAIQTANRLGTGTNKDILSYFSKNDRDRIIKLVKELEPELFVGVTKEKTTERFVNNYIYYASGEFQAFGLGGIGTIGFYPLIITRDKGKTTIQFRNGESFTTTGIALNTTLANGNIIEHFRYIIKKHYSSYEIKPGQTMEDKRLNQLKLLRQKYSLQDKKKKDYQILEMLATLRSPLDTENFKNSNVIGIVINGKKYVVENLDHIETLIDAINERRSETKVQVTAFTFQPKDIDYFSALNKSHEDYPFGYIEIADNKMSNVRNAIVEVDKYASEVTSQSLIEKDTDIEQDENPDIAVVDLNTQMDIPTQSLDTTEDFVSEQKEKAPVEPAKKTEPTKAKSKNIVDYKIIDKRPKSERKKKFVYDSKKYDRYRTPIGDAKNPTRIVSAKDIDKEVENTDKQISATGRGNSDYVYRRFIERRYYIKNDAAKSEGYKDIFEYYSPKKERRHTLKSETENTDLRYFTTEKGKSQITMSPGLREFVIATTYTDVDPLIMKEIRNGTLTTNDLLHYIMDLPVEEVDNHTFRLILEKVYENTSIKTRKELDELAFRDEAKMGALYFVLKNTDFDYMLHENLKPGKLDEIWNFAMSQSKFVDELNRIYIALSSGKSHSLRTFKISEVENYPDLDADVLSKESLYKTITLYRGDIASGSKAIIKARKATFKDGLTVGSGYQQSRFGQKSKFSLDSKIKEGAKVSFLDQTSVKEDTPEVDDIFANDYDDIIRELSDVSQPLGKKVFITLSQKIMKEHNNDYTFTKISLAKYMTNLSNLSEDQAIALYQRLLNGLDEESLAKLYYLAELPGFEDVVIENEYTKEQGVKNTLNKVVNYGSKVQGIKRRLATIRKYVKTTVEKNLVLSEYSDILDENLNLKQEVYRLNNGYRTIEEINQIAERIAELSTDVKSGVYRDRTSYNRHMKELNELKKYQRELIDAINSDKKSTAKMINVSTEDGNIEIKTKSEIPKSIRQILSTGLTRTGISKVQELSNYHNEYTANGDVNKVYDDRYLKLTMTHLLDSNAALLNGLSQDEAVEILEFYVGDNIIMADIDSQIVSETVRLTCAYILGEDRNSAEKYGKGFTRFNLDESLVKRVEAKMIEQAHMSAVMLSNQRTVIRKLQPKKIIVQSLAKNLGFELDEVDEKNLDEMLRYMRRGDQKKYREAKEIFESKLIKDYPEKTKQSKLDKILAFERAMMLSNPGTWLRNQASNLVVRGGNWLSSKTGKTINDLILKVFPKFGAIDTGYSLDKKASAEVVKFIDNKFINSGVLDEIVDGVSKYDVPSGPASDNIVDMIARSIYTKIRRENVFKDENFGKLANKATRFIYKMISDDPYVKKAIKKYLGQIIQEDYERVRIKAAEKGKTLTIEKYLAEDKSNMYGLSKPIISAFVKAVDLASYDYMKTPNFITQMERALRESVPKGAYFMYKQVFPFLASSWNWCVEGMRYTPLGLANSIIKLARLEHTINQMDKAYSHGKSIVSGDFAKYLQIRNIGKGTIGTLTFTIGMLLVSLGWAGIDEEDDEYKLLVIDAKININDVVGSQGIMLGIAFMQNATNEGKDIEDVFSEVFNQLFRDSIFQDFIDTFRYDTGMGDFVWSKFWDLPTQFYPNFLRSIASIAHHRGIDYSTDPFLSKLQKLALQALPLPAEWVGANTKVNVYTGQTESFFSGGLYESLIARYSPVDVSWPHVSKNEIEAIGLGIKKGELNGRYTIGDDEVTLSSKERSKLNTLYGKLNKSKLDKLYNNSIEVKVKTKDGTYEYKRYSKMTDNEKRAAVNNIMSTNSSFSKIYILTSTGKYAYYASESEYNELRKLGITKNVYKKTKKKEGFIKI